MKLAVKELSMEPRPVPKDWKPCKKFGWCAGVEEVKNHAGCPAEIVHSLGTKAGQVVKCECECHG
jgi:hypothetical protein